MNIDDTNNKELNIDETNLDETITKDNDTTPISSNPKTTDPIKKLRIKVKQHLEREEQENNFTPFFNISLVDDTPPSIKKENKKQSLDTIRIMKEQETVSKLDAIISTSLATKKAGIHVDTSKDNQLLNSVDSPKSIKKKSIKNKIEKPLHLKGHIKEEDLSKALEGIKVATQTLTQDALIDMPSSDLDELNNAKSDEELAQIILEKTGRKKISIKENKDKSLKQFKKEDETAQKKDQNN